MANDYARAGLNELPLRRVVAFQWCDIGLFLWRETLHPCSRALNPAQQPSRSVMPVVVPVAAAANALTIRGLLT
jgi:hypothetical protein